MSENEFCARIDAALDLKPDAQFEVFGRTLSISGAILNGRFLDKLYKKHLSISDSYPETFRKSGSGLTFIEILENFDIELDTVLAPIFDELTAIIQNAGIGMTHEYLRDTYCRPFYDYHAQKVLIPKFNSMIDEQNRMKYYYNQAKAGSSLEKGYKKEIERASPFKLVSDPETKKLLAKSIHDTIFQIIYASFPIVINTFAEKQRFLTVSEKQNINEPLTRYDALSHEDKISPAGLSLLLDALQADPANESTYEELYINHVTAGCGFDAVTNYANGEKGAVRLKWKLIKAWIPTFEYHRIDTARRFVKMFDELCERWELKKEDMEHVFIFRTWIDNMYKLEDIIFHSKLSRINGMPFNGNDEPADHPKLIQMASDALDGIARERHVADNKFFKDNLLALREPLIALINEDSRTVFGKIYPTYEDAKQVRDETAEVMELYHNTNFSDAAAAGRITGAVLQHHCREDLVPLLSKAERAAELSLQIDAFLSEVNDRVYQNRQEAAYDFMRGKIFEDERVLLEMNRKDLLGWYSGMEHTLACAFEKRYVNIFDAATAYFNILHRAWTYQAHLDEKSNAKGLFKKIAATVSGLVSMGEFEPDYMLATENGTKALAPIAENEQANVESYYKYMNDERTRIKLEYFERFDPTAADCVRRMDELKTDYRSFNNAITLSYVVDNTVNFNF